MSIWEFNRKLVRRLLGWNILNILSGLWIAQAGGFWRGFGSQNIGWGAINIAIAIFGGRMTQQRMSQLNNPNEPEILAKEARNLRWLLIINAVLDLFYMRGGWRLAQGAKRQTVRGIGYGIIVQGLLLLIFDVSQARAVPSVSNVSEETRV